VSRSRAPGGSQGLTPARRWVVALGAAAATLAVAAVLAALWALWTYQGPGPAPPKGAAFTRVILRQGSSLTEIASTLERAGAVRSSSVFMAAAQLTGAARELKAGEYAFPARASMALVLDKIRDGRVVRRFLTIPEGFTSEMVADVLSRTSALSGEAPLAPEGAVLPDTYQYELGDDRAAILKRMMDARDETLATLWAKRQPNLPFSTPEEAVTLASVVEKETGIASERPRVASVFVNRLRTGMRLESDPTVIYGVSRGRPLGRGLKQSELTAPNPYNTYLNTGLPPTPIANPGRASLAAVLDPPATKDLFFVADGTGGHVFAATFPEHLRNVARWRAVEKTRAAAAVATPVKTPQVKTP
jgi:UPF0755 protein